MAPPCHHLTCPARLVPQVRDWEGGARGSPGLAQGYLVPPLPARASAPRSSGPSAAPFGISARGLLLLSRTLFHAIPPARRERGGGGGAAGTRHTAGARPMPVDSGTLQAAGQGPCLPRPGSTAAGPAGCFGHSSGPWVAACQEGHGVRPLCTLLIRLGTPGPRGLGASG